MYDWARIVKRGWCFAPKVRRKRKVLSDIHAVGTGSQAVHFTEREFDAWRVLIRMEGQVAQDASSVLFSMHSDIHARINKASPQVSQKQTSNSCS